MVSPPPWSSYYSPRVAPYSEVRPYPDYYRDQYDDRYHDVSWEWESADQDESSADDCPSRGGSSVDSWSDVQVNERDEVLTPGRQDVDYDDGYFVGADPNGSPRSSKRAPPIIPTTTTTTSASAHGPRPVTAQDRAEAGIPAGYSTKNWDPAEEPIFLLGSVFDANSLGKWIYDWTFYRHGPDTIALVVAGELWLALIALAGKMQRAESLLHQKVKRGRYSRSSSSTTAASKRKMIEDFLDDGDELWDRIRDLLRACERSMMRVAHRNRRTGQVLSMGANSGCEFVDCVFGPSRQLDATEDLIDSIVSWYKRFDATFNKKATKHGRRRR